MEVETLMQDSKGDPASDRGVAAPALPKLARQHLHDTVVSHLRRMIGDVVVGWLTTGKTR